MKLGCIVCWLVLGFGCARGAEDQPDGRVVFDVFPSDRSVDRLMDQTVDPSLDRVSDAPSADAGACLSVRRTRTYQSSGNTTGSSVLFDRGSSPNSTSVCPLSVAPTDVTSDSPAQLFRLCNQESTSMTFSLGVEATYDVWVAAYTGYEVPANPQQCLVMNDDDRRNPNISTTNAFIPSLTIPAGGVVTLVITGITREQSGPFDLTLTPL